MSMRDEIMTKVESYFDRVDSYMDCKDYTNAQIYMAKLSKYFHIMDDELSDYYQYLTDMLEGTGHPVEVLDEEFYYYDNDWPDTE